MRFVDIAKKSDAVCAVIKLLENPDHHDQHGASIVNTLQNEVAKPLHPSITSQILLTAGKISYENVDLFNGLMEAGFGINPDSYHEETEISPALKDTVFQLLLKESTTGEFIESLEAIGGIFAVMPDLSRVFLPNVLTAIAVNIENRSKGGKQFDLNDSFAAGQIVERADGLLSMMASHCMRTKSDLPFILDSLSQLPDRLTRHFTGLVIVGGPQHEQLNL